MKHRIVVVLLFAITFISALEEGHPTIHPTIQLLQPRGFRVSLPHEDGVELFVFRGTVNRPVLAKESESFFEEVTQPTHRLWIFEDRRTELRKGDVIFFKMKIVKDLQGYTWVGEFVVPDTFITTTESLHLKPSISPIDTAPTPGRLPVHHHTTPATTQSQPIDHTNRKTQKPDNEFQTSLDLANTIYNTVENLTVEIKRLREINAILVELVEQDSLMAKTLSLRGMLPPYDDPIYVVHVVLKEKLRVSVPVLAARKNSDGSITFELASVNDKIQVIKSAKKNLSDSKIHLVY